MQGMGNRQGVYDGKIAGLYDLEETLGSGHFAVVKLARHVFTGEKVAVKVIDKTKLDEVSRAHLFQEVRCMKLVQHPNVVRLYEVIDTQTKLYLILELGDGGDLYDYIMRHEGGLSEQLAIEYFRQIVRAISYCHQLHVVHRDLKPENVVFFEKLGVVKLTDFGFSNKFCPGQKLETSCGSLAYSAPEILLGDSYDAPAVDVWSLGVILFMLVCGQPPFQEANDSETLTMIMDCKYTMPAHVSSDCRRLIGTMLVREPEKRATLQQIAKDKWLIQTGQDQIPEYLPLVSREQVSEEDHNLIIQKMVNGSIATKEDILEALDRNEYNHITATYFLLVERKLRAHRQEQAQKKRPDLSLAVSGTSRLSPRSRGHGIKRDQQFTTNNDETNNLLIPSNTQTLLTIPRTPGAEGGQSGRIRKCSIVQEEEDDEDEISSCSGREELQSPLNRRGSRSEGRINIAIQDRIAEAERLKKDTATTTITTPIQQVPQQIIKSTGIDTGTTKIQISKVVDGISGVTLISNDSCNANTRLGTAGRGIIRQIGDFRPRTAEQQLKNNNNIINNNNSPSKWKANITENNKQYQLQQRSNSVDKCITKSIIKDANETDIINTKILIDSSTITIPIVSSTNMIQQTIIPKYKTMPSPTRPNTILTGTNCLNEIYEEGTDIGSSDTSATTTPKSLTRHNHYLNHNNRSQSQGTTTTTTTTISSSSTTTTTQQRRIKFNKTRTASCSSSDASDDDSENRKKRAHKIVDVTIKPSPQRRDSHDDSSDSQDPGNTAASGGSNTTATTSYSIHITSAPNSTSSQHQESSSSSTTGGGRQKTVVQQSGFRRHRAGRRRAGETRLRESQSLNRITEVQESEIPLTSLVPPIIPILSSSTSTQSVPVVKKGFSARLFHGFRKSDPTPNVTTAIPTMTTITTTTTATTTTTKNNQTEIPRVPSQTDPPDDEVEMALGAELAKALRVSETKTTSSTSKKLKILGKYFQVHKKLCIPGIFQRGRLYKAQSCGSIVRDKVNQQSSRSVTNVVTSGRGGTNNNNNNNNNNNQRHHQSSALFSDKTRILRNCLGVRLIGSDSDINQNNDNNKITSSSSTTSTSLQQQNIHFTTTGTGTTKVTGNKNCSLTKTPSPIHHIGDGALCSSKC